MSIKYDSSVVAGALSPLVSAFDQTALQSLVDFRADEQTQLQFEMLSEKASDGTISAEEQRAYDSIVGTSAILAVLQAEAEKLLGHGCSTGK